MRNKQRCCGQLQNHVRIANFRGTVEKLPFPQNLRISSWSYDMAGHAKKCVERYCESANKTTQQLYKSINSMHWWPSFQRRRIEIRGRIVKSMLSNCSEMLKLGTYWDTRHSLVSKQTCSTCLNVDKSLWQTIGKIDFIHSSHKRFPTTLSCGEALQTGFLSRLWRSWGLKINLARSLVYFRKSHVCANKLDVQETDFSFTQFYVSWNSFSRCTFTHGWYSQLLIFGICFFDVFHSSQNQFNKNKGLSVQGNLLHDTTSNKHTQNQNQGSNPARHFWSVSCWQCAFEREVFSF